MMVAFPQQLKIENSRKNMAKISKLEKPSKNLPYMKGGSCINTSGYSLVPWSLCAVLKFSLCDQ